MEPRTTQDVLKEIVQDCHLNILVGSGLSMPYLSTLGAIETHLTELDGRDDLPRGQRDLIRAALYKKYFLDVAARNVNILEPDADVLVVLNQYRAFLQTVSEILLRRKTPILSKEANVFTTNIDIFMERALEDLQIDYNDGFNGRFKPVFSMSNFKKSHFKRSPHYDNMSEIPVVNLCKLHGSVCWELQGSGVAFSSSLAHVGEVEVKAGAATQVPVIPPGADLPILVALTNGQAPNAATMSFIDAYEKLLVVVNPTKEKFKHTLLNQTYYELLRLYSNELEKENTLLLVMGFSFADEHIREITLRAANSNPTLVVWVVCHSTSAAAEISARLSPVNALNRNIKLISPEQDDAPGGGKVDMYHFDLATINSRLLSPLRDSVADS